MMIFFFFSDGKFHVVPSGDLHILRADLPSDGAVDYTCKVRNKLTSTEHSSPAFSLIIDGKCHELNFVAKSCDSRISVLVVTFCKSALVRTKQQHKI